MPGLVGIITKAPYSRAADELRQMVASVGHQPSYESGCLIDASHSVYVGWTARRGSFSDGMPLKSGRGSTALIFSGEEFSSPGTSAGAGGVPSNAHAPVSYLLRMYESDPTFPRSLNGRFHGIVLDRDRGTVALFNDRYGMHRLYYHDSEDGFYFSCEAKAILQVRRHLRSAETRGLADLAANGCVLDNRTLFRGVNVLPGGSLWVFRNGRIAEKGTYFDGREWETDQSLEPEAYYRHLREVFSSRLSSHFAGPESVAVSLTGGLDTRAIMAWHKAPQDSLRCYTFGGMFRDSRDVTVARQVARLCGQSHHVISVGPDFLGQFAKFAERAIFLSDGCTGVRHAADLYVNQEGARIAPVRMTGNYGDEVFRRLRVFKPRMPGAPIFDQEFLEQLAAAHGRYARAIDCHPLTFAVFRQAPWYSYGLLALEETQLSVRTPFLDNEVVRAAYQAPPAAIASNALRMRLIEDGNSELGKIRSDLGFGRSTWPAVDFIEQRFHAFTMRAEYAYDYGMPQWLARADQLMAPLQVERLFLGRHKFCHFRTWYRRQLSEYVRGILLDDHSLARPYVRPDVVRQVVASHLSGTRNYTTELHLLLDLELIHRLFLDNGTQWADLPQHLKTSGGHGDG